MNPTSLPKREDKARARRTPWRTLGGLAAAVALGLFLLWELVILPPGRFDRMASFRDAVAYYIAEVPFQLDFTSADQTDIQRWLEASELPMMPEIPVELGARVPFGCKEISWGEVKVSLVCFYESGSSGRIIHLFVAPRDAVDESLIASLDSVEFKYKRETRGWVSGDKVCMLVPSNPEMRIAHLLDGEKLKIAS
jgi:hypothetical protein